MKKWYESKTIWVNVISFIVEIINMVIGNSIIPVKYSGVLTLIVNTLNIFLRTITKMPINNGKEYPK